MKTLSAAFLALLLGYVHAIGADYEYFRMSDNNTTLELAEGETAIPVGVSGIGSIANGTSHVEFKVSFDGSKYNFFASSDARHVNPVIVGPCTIIFKGSSYDDSPLINWRITRANTTTASNDPTPTDYTHLAGWVFFTEYPWVFSDMNKSWYYLTAQDPGIFAYNENLPGDKWTILQGND